MLDVTVRLATPDDAEELAVLLRAFNAEFGEPAPAEAVLAERISRALAGGSAFSVVAGHPIVSFGFVTLRPALWSAGPAAILDELYTVPARRSESIGAQVFEMILSEARARGVEDLQIPVDEADHDAHRFYERHGFPVIRPATGDRALLLEYAGSAGLGGEVESSQSLSVQGDHNGR
ncbi:GNAT family N-acetyltransferase [Corynebacterium sp. S7]